MNDGTIPGTPVTPGDQFAAIALVAVEPGSESDRNAPLPSYQWFFLVLGTQEECNQAAEAAVQRGWYSYERDDISYTGRVVMVAVKPQ